MASSGCAFSFAVRAGRVEALACWFDKHARVQGGGRESPGMRVTFFCFAKRKSPKKRRPPVCDPGASLRGKPASSRLRGAPWNSLRCVAASFRHPRRVSSRSTRAATRVPPHNRPAAGTASRGGSQTAGHPFGPSLRSASSCGCKRRALGKLGRAKQRPAWLFGSLCPSGCAEKHRVWRIRARVCLSDAQRRELSETPPNPSTAGCPGAQRRGRRQWGRPFFGSFLSATRKKGTRTPGDSRPPPSTKARGSVSARNKTLQNQ
jgi:hypothetical protein